MANMFSFRMWNISCLPGEDANICCHFCIQFCGSLAKSIRNSLGSLFQPKNTVSTINNISVLKKLINNTSVLKKRLICIRFGLITNIWIYELFFQSKKSFKILYKVKYIEVTCCLFYILVPFLIIVGNSIFLLATSSSLPFWVSLYLSHAFHTFSYPICQMGVNC